MSGVRGPVFIPAKCLSARASCVPRTQDIAFELNPGMFFLRPLAERTVLGLSQQPPTHIQSPPVAWATILRFTQKHISISTQKKPRHVSIIFHFLYHQLLVVHTIPLMKLYIFQQNHRKMPMHQNIQIGPSTMPKHLASPATRALGRLLWMPDKLPIRKAFMKATHIRRHNLTLFLPI